MGGPLTVYWAFLRKSTTIKQGPRNKPTTLGGRMTKNPTTNYSNNDNLKYIQICELSKTFLKYIKSYLKHFLARPPIHLGCGARPAGEHAVLPEAQRAGPLPPRARRVREGCTGERHPGLTMPFQRYSEDLRSGLCPVTKSVHVHEY